VPDCSVNLNSVIKKIFFKKILIIESNNSKINSPQLVLLLIKSVSVTLRR